MQREFTETKEVDYGKQKKKPIIDFRLGLDYFSYTQLYLNMALLKNCPKTRACQHTHAQSYMYIHTDPHRYICLSARYENLVNYAITLICLNMIYKYR